MRCRVFASCLISLTGFLATRAAPESPYGATSHVSRDEFTQRDRIFEMCHVGGIGQIRFDCQMRDLRPAATSAWDFARYDRIVASADRCGVTLLPILFAMPGWASPVWEHTDAYADFARTLAQRYGSKMPVFEIWNEQNIPSFWRPQPCVSNYLAALRAARVAVKAVDPGIRIALGGLAGTDPEYLEELYALGGGPDFDIMNVHPYSHPYPPEGRLDRSLEALRALMTKHGDGEKPIWITEHGWPTHRHGVGAKSGHFIRTGLRMARPEKKTWNIVCAVCQPDDARIDATFAESLLELLPQGSRVEACTPARTIARLQAGGVDAVLYPTDESFPVVTVEAVAAFVKDGGTLIDIGGMPAWRQYRVAPNGSVSYADSSYDAAHYKALRIGVDAWWLGPKTAPKELSVYASDAARTAGLRQEPTGFKVVHFVNDRLLKPGDRMIPMLTGVDKATGKTYVGACLYAFDSDYKGRVVVSTVKMSDSLPSNDETRQALYLARSLGITFAEGVEKYFVYEFRAPERDPWYSEHHFGIVHRNLAPKPAYGAYMHFTLRHPVGSQAWEAAWHDAAREVYYPQWTLPDGCAAGMIWTRDRTCRQVLSFAGDGVRFFDVWGKPLFPPAAGAQAWNVELSGSPVYFEGARLVSGL